MIIYIFVLFPSSASSVGNYAPPSYTRLLTNKGHEFEWRRVIFYSRYLHDSFPKDLKCLNYGKKNQVMQSVPEHTSEGNREMKAMFDTYIFHKTSERLWTIMVSEQKRRVTSKFSKLSLAIRTQVALTTRERQDKMVISPWFDFFYIRKENCARVAE